MNYQVPTVNFQTQMNVSAFDQTAVSRKGVISLAVTCERLTDCRVALEPWLHS